MSEEKHVPGAGGVGAMRRARNLQEEGGKNGSKFLRGALKVAGAGRGFQMQEFHLHPPGSWEPLKVVGMFIGQCV